jgi:outer membrane receptor for ferrienterochelin and colicins
MSILQTLLLVHGKLKCLGLNSPYILIATENIPAIRGASQAYGLSFIPGTWGRKVYRLRKAQEVLLMDLRV